MIISLSNNKTIDTDQDLTGAERHILQKMFAAKDLAQTHWEFKDRRIRAFQVGWGDSGPVRERDVMRSVIDDLEKQFIERLEKQRQAAREKQEAP